MAKKENSLAHTKWMCKYHTESGKTFWKMLNGVNIPVINPK